jgi:hypothetical protein
MINTELARIKDSAYVLHKDNGTIEKLQIMNNVYLSYTNSLLSIFRLRLVLMTSIKKYFVDFCCSLVLFRVSIFFLDVYYVQKHNYIGLVISSKTRM